MCVVTAIYFTRGKIRFNVRFLIRESCKIWNKGTIEHFFTKCVHLLKCTSWKCKFSVSLDKKNVVSLGFKDVKNDTLSVELLYRDTICIILYAYLWRLVKLILWSTNNYTCKLINSNSKRLTVNIHIINFFKQDVHFIYQDKNNVDLGNLYNLNQIL